MKIEDNVPITMPMPRANAMTWMTPVPKKKNAETDKSVVSDVTRVRDSICEVLMLISSRRL